LDATTVQALRDLIVSKGHVVVLTEPAGSRVRALADAPSPIRFNAFSRLITASGDESGRQDFNQTLGDRSVLGWQPVQGGFYYLASDNKLHFLRGGAN